MVDAADDVQGKGKDDLSSSGTFDDAAAWADSCLAKNEDDSEELSHSDDAWASLTEHFISALASFPSTADDDEIIPNHSSIDSPEPMSIDSSAGELISKIAREAFNHAGADRQVLDLDIARESFSGLVEEFKGEREEPAVLPGKEFPDEHDYGDAGEEFSGVADGKDLANDIFKVWDLRISGEEEDIESELSSRLKKALEQTSSIALDDDPKLVSLVSAISDLSISPPPPRSAEA